MAIPVDEMQSDFGALFSSPLGRRVLQAICQEAGVFDAPVGLSTEELRDKNGARALALDICNLAGAMPEVPGSGGAPVPDLPGEALHGPRADDEGDDEGDEAPT